MCAHELKRESVNARIAEFSWNIVFKIDLCLLFRLSLHVVISVQFLLFYCDLKHSLILDAFKLRKFSVDFDMSMIANIFANM